MAEEYTWLLTDARSARVNLENAISLEQLKPAATRLADVVVRLLERLEAEEKK